MTVAEPKTVAVGTYAEEKPTMARAINCGHQVFSRWQQEGCVSRDSLGLRADSWTHQERHGGEQCLCVFPQGS